jgi:hypothetical protein
MRARIAHANGLAFTEISVDLVHGRQDQDEHLWIVNVRCNCRDAGDRTFAGCGIQPFARVLVSVSVRVGSMLAPSQSTHVFGLEACHRRTSRQWSTASMILRRPVRPASGGVCQKVVSLRLFGWSPAAVSRNGLYVRRLFSPRRTARARKRVGIGGAIAEFFWIFRASRSWGKCVIRFVKWLPVDTATVGPRIVDDSVGRRTDLSVGWTFVSI